MHILDEFLIKSHLLPIPNWPSPGLRYRDITPLFSDPKSARMITDALTTRYLDWDFTHIVALDGLGFLLGSNLAYTLNKPLLLASKQSRCPGLKKPDMSDDPLMLRSGSLTPEDKVLIVDDVIGKGDAMLEASQLIKSYGATMVEGTSILSLVYLGGIERLREAGIPSFSLIMCDEP